MSRSRIRSLAAVCLSSLAAAEAARSQTTERVGVEFQVNAYTAGNQFDPVAAMDDEGDFVVAWESYGQDGSSHGIFARRYDSAGAPVGGEFQVNTYTGDSQRYPAVAMNGDGAFVVTWASSSQDGDLHGIFAQRFDAAGMAQGAELPVNSQTVNNQVHPAAGIDGDGDFVIVWQSALQDGNGFGVFAQRFDPSGAAQGGEFQVNAYTPGSQLSPAIGMADNGNFVVAWGSANQDGASSGIFARRFDAAGTGQGGEFQVNLVTVNSQSYAAVASSDGGDFVVAWQSNLQDRDLEGVFARRFSAAGAGQGGEFQVNAYTQGAQVTPAAGMDGDGDFVVAWASIEQDGDMAGTFVRRFNGSGSAQAELQASSYTAYNQSRPGVAIDVDGDFVVVWRSVQDGSLYGVFAQRFFAGDPLDIDGNGKVEPLTDGLLVLRFEFGFTGATLITGAVDLAGCTRCTALEIEAHLRTIN